MLSGPVFSTGLSGAFVRRFCKLDYGDFRFQAEQFSYDADGNLTNLVYPGGKNVYYSYDLENHLTNVTDWSGRVTTMTYDLNGRLTAVYRPNGTIRTIAYDSDGEETNIIEQTVNGIPIAWFRYNWNPATEMGWEFAAPLPHVTSLPTRQMTYDQDNELQTVDGNPVALDANGNLLSGPLTNDTSATYTYDVRNRLTSAGGVTNIYDAANNCIGQFYGTNSTVYIVNPNVKLPQVLMRIKNGVTNYYVYGHGLLYQVTEQATSTNTLSYHYDYRGSTVALTDDNGNIRDRFEYSLYATLTYSVGADETPFLFNGQYGVMCDPNGLLYMQARYYDPYLCRFLNPDPSGFSAGLNFYAYANGNPADNVDPSGLQIPSPLTANYGWQNMGQWGSDAQYDQMVQNGAWEATAMEGSVLGGVAVGAGGAAIVTVSAPAAYTVLVGAGLTPATASATVTTTLYVGGLGGGLLTTYNAINSAEEGDLDAVGFDIGTLGGGSLVGGLGGGRFIADNASPAPSTVPVSDNPFTADYQSTPTAPNGYGFTPTPGVPLYQDLWNFAGTGPTPSSGGGSAALISSGIGSSSTGK